MQRLLVITALTSVVVFATFMTFCATHDIHGPTDFRNYRIMRSSTHPVVIALADGSLVEGSRESALFAIATPVWTDDYGRYQIHGFAPKQSYDSITVQAIDGRLVAAGTGSCTWGWSFFYNVADDIALAASALDTLRDTIERRPEDAAMLKPCFDDVEFTLGIKSNLPENGG